MDDINQIGAATLGDQPSEVNQVGAATLSEEDLPRKLADATDYYRRNASDFWGPGTKAYLESRLPGVSEQQSIEHAGRVQESARALQEGWAKPEHIYTLAQDQARKEYEASRQGWDKAVDLATSLPKMGAEYYLGGKVAQAIPGMAGANFAQTEAARAAFMPSTYEDIAHRYASGEGLEASAFKGALAGTIQNVAMSAAGTFLPKLATQGGVGYLKGAAYSAAKAVGGAQAAKEGLYQAALSGDPSEIHKIATGPDRLQAIKDMGPEILVFGSLEAALHGIPILAEHIADLKKEGIKPESPKGQEQIAQTVDQLRQEATPPAPKAYANHPDDQLIELAQGLGMDAQDKATKGDFTRADAEKYLQKHGVREEMLDEPRPAKPQVIRPEAQQQAIDALVRSGMSQEEATRRTAEAFANAPQTVFPKTEGAKLKTSPSLDALDAEFEVVPPKPSEGDQQRWQKTLGEVENGPIPQYTKDNIKAMTELAIKNGNARKIEDLAAQRKTAKEIAKVLNIDQGDVAQIRIGLGIPSQVVGGGMGPQTPNPDFAVWLKSRQASPKTVTMYHGGEPQGESPMWVTPDLEYARGYARKSGSPVYSLEVPEDHPLLQKAFDDSGTNMKAPYQAFEAPAELAKNRKLHEPAEANPQSGPHISAASTEPAPPSTIPPEAKASRAHQAQPEPPAQTPEERVAALRAQHAASQAQVDQATRAETEAIQRRRKGLKADVEGARATRQAWEERHAVLEDKIRAAGGIVPGEEPVPPKDFAPVAKEMGLNDREQYVLLKKSEGALNPDLIGDPNLPGITTRGGVNELEVRARKKVNKYLKEHGLKEMGSINETVAKPDQESAKEEAKSIRTDALDKQGSGVGYVDQGEQAGYVKKTAAEQLSDDWTAYLEKLKGSNEYRSLAPSDAAKLDQILNGRFEQGPPRESIGELLSQREPAHEAPVRPASGGGVPEGAESSSANPPQETPGRAQGQREPAPATGSEAAGNELTAEQRKAARNWMIDHDWTEEDVAKMSPTRQDDLLAKNYPGGIDAFKANNPSSEAAGNELSKDSPFHPDNLQAQAKEILANNKEVVDRHNEILREARSALKEYGGDYRLIHLERYADATSIKGLDQVAEHLQAEHPEWFTGRENTDDTLFNILKAGNKKYLTKDQALRQAETWAHGQATPEDVTETNQELKKANLGQATRDDLREVERQARLEVAKQAGIDPDELGDAHEPPGDAPSFDFGGEPGEPGEPGRPVSREQAVENWQDRFEDAPAGTQTNFLPGSFGSLTGEQRSLFDTSAVKGEHTQKPDMPGQTHFNFGEPVSPEERTGLPGGGQEAPEQSRPQRLTALANEITERERAKEKLPPLSPSERLENSEVWQGALRAVEKDPAAPQRLVDELSKKMRPVTVEENALLLYQKVALKNELERATLNFLAETKGKRMQDMDAITWARLMEPVTELEDRLFKTQQLIHDAGTPLGRALQFRKQLAAEDYSLGGMLMEASAAKGDRLTPEERVKIAEMSAKIADLEAKLKEAQANAEGAKLGTKARQEADKARVDTQAAKDEFTRMTNDWRRQPRGPIRKLTDLLTKIRVNEVISSPVTAGKIITASMERVATTTLEEAAGAMLRKIPGLDKIAALAPRQGRGFSLAKEMSLAKEAFTTGLKDAWQTARTGESDIDILHKPKGDKLSRDFLDYQFSLHDAAKAPAVRAEYTRSLLDRQEHMIANGVDPTTPARVMQNELLAYKDSQAAKFRQENWLVDSYNRMVNSLRSEKAPVASQITGGALKILTPVVRIPTNLAFEVATHVFGTGTGTIQAARAFSRGLENLKPGEADQIMRQFKKGSLGAALLLVGVFNRNSIGGYYSGKRDEGDVKAGTIRIGGVDLPAWVLHNPLLETMQIGATLGRAYDKFTRKGDSKVSAAAEATGQTVAGWLEELPLVRETGQVTGLTSPRDSERGHAWAEMTKSLAIPQFFQWLAGATDRNSQGKPIERKPKGFAETLKVGVPGLRQTVPVK